MPPWSAGEAGVSAGGRHCGPHPAAQRELEAAGYPRPRIAYLPHGVPLPPPRSKQSQAAARAALAESHAALQLPEGAGGRRIGFRSVSHDLQQLLTAWQPIAKNLPFARLWLIGPVADRAAAKREVERRQLSERVVLPGVFDQVDGLLAAADLLVAPAAEGAPMALLEAMAAELPIVAADTAANRSVLADQQEGLLRPAGNTVAILTAMGSSKEPDLAARLGIAARRRVETEFSLASMADQHLTWFEQLVGK